MGGFQKSGAVEQKLVIIGLDGADWQYIQEHRPHLPTLTYLLDNFGGELESNGESLHSAACWSQAFAGTTFGLTDFPKDAGKAAEVRSSDRWLWHGMEDISVVIGVPAVLPPISVNHQDGAGWLQTVLSITVDEMLQATYRRAVEMSQAWRSNVGLYVTVWPATDRAGHIFGMDAEETLSVYQAVDGQLNGLWRRLCQNHWIILSDHGMSDTPTDWEPKDTRKGWHRRGGIIASSLSSAPEKLSEVYSWILQGPNQEG